MVTVLIFLVAAAISVTLLVLELCKHRQRTRAGEAASVLELPDDRKRAAWPDDKLPPAA